MIDMISNLRLFKPVQITQKGKRDFYHVNFRDKGLDYINLSGILRTDRVKNKIPNYFNEKDPPIIGYKFNKSIAGQLFNYKQTLSEEVLHDFENNNIQCDCQNSRFKDDGHGHIITGMGYIEVFYINQMNASLMDPYLNDNIYLYQGCSHSDTMGVGDAEIFSNLQKQVL